MRDEAEKSGNRRPWTVWLDLGPAPAEEKVAREEDLLAGVAAGRLGPVCRVWTSGPCLVLGRLEARRLDQAGRLVARFRDVPVLVRPSGGTAVPHGPDDLNLTLCYPATEVPAPPEAGYRLLLAGLRRALAGALGLEAGSGWAPGSFCDGRHNLLVGRRKVAGTAQAQRRGAVLVHATLMVGGEGAARLRQVARFYRELGIEGSWDEGSVASLEEILGRPLRLQDLAGPIVEAFLAGVEPEGAIESHDES